MIDEVTLSYHRGIADSVCSLFKAGREDAARALVKEVCAHARFEHYSALAQPMRLAPDDQAKYDSLKKTYSITDAEFERSLAQELGGVLAVEDHDGEWQVFSEHWTRIVVRGDEQWLHELAMDARDWPNDV